MGSVYTCLVHKLILLRTNAVLSRMSMHTNECRNATCTHRVATQILSSNIIHIGRMPHSHAHKEVTYNTSSQPGLVSTSAKRATRSAEDSMLEAKLDWHLDVLDRRPMLGDL